MKRRILYLTLAMILALPLTACGESEQTVTTSASNGQTTEQTPPPTETAELKTTEPETEPVEDTVDDIVEDKGQLIATLFDGTEVYEDDFKNNYFYWYATGEMGAVPLTCNYTGYETGKEISIPFGQDVTIEEIINMNDLNNSNCLYNSKFNFDSDGIFSSTAIIPDYETSDIFDKVIDAITVNFEETTADFKLNDIPVSDIEKASDLLGTPSYIRVSQDGNISEAWTYDDFYIQLEYNTDNKLKSLLVLSYTFNPPGWMDAGYPEKPE